MRRFSLLFAFVFAFLTLALPASATFAAPQAQPTADPAAQMQRVIELVNQRRKEAGVGPVTFNAALATCAQKYSEVQAQQGKIDHTGPDGSNPGQRLRACGYNWKHYGENLAAGYANAEDVVNAWMNSPSHRKVMLNGKYKEIGMGFTRRDDDPGHYYDYFVMELGTRK